MATLAHMGRKRKDGSGHVTPRRPIQFPAAWYAVAQKMAVARQQPTTWFLVALVEKAAREQGIKELPALPWEEDVKG